MSSPSVAFKQVANSSPSFIVNTFVAGNLEDKSLIANLFICPNAVTNIIELSASSATLNYITDTICSFSCNDI